mgnify:CR=1 FL=1
MVLQAARRMTGSWEALGHARVMLEKLGVSPWRCRTLGLGQSLALCSCAQPLERLGV